MSGLFGVLMAGGSGTRFWPASRSARPKQLLPMGGDAPLLVRTSRRLLPAIPPERQLVVTSARTVDAVRAALPDIPADQVIGEPVGRDTAPCVGLASRLVERLDPEATVVAMPSDHVIAPEDRFLEFLAVAEDALASRPDTVLVFGLEPDHPATGFGWLRRGEPVGEFGGHTVYALDAFLEKPDRARAEQLLAAGGHAWNAGLFAFRPAGLQAAYETHLPDMVPGLVAIADSWGSPDFEAVLAREFGSLRAISIDHGLMELMTGALMLPLPLQWNDVGAWSALARLREADADGNVADGEAVTLEAHRNLIAATEGGLVAVKGVDDLIVVHTPDATLVCRRDDDQGVKQIVEELRARGLDRYL